MADPVQTNINEFYLLRTAPSKVYRRLVSAQVDYLKVGKEGEVMSCCEIGQRSMVLVSQDIQNSAPVERVVCLKSKTVVRERQWLDFPTGLGCKEEALAGFMNRGLAVYMGAGLTDCTGSIRIRKNGEYLGVLEPCSIGFRGVITADSNRVVYQIHNLKLAQFRWKDLHRGIFESRNILDFVEVKAVEDTQICNVILEPKGATVIFSNGYVKLASTDEPRKVASNARIDFLAKINKNFYAYSSLISETESPGIVHQAIRVIDRDLKQFGEFKYLLEDRSGLRIGELHKITDSIFLAEHDSKIIRLYQWNGKSLVLSFSKKSREEGYHLYLGCYKNKAFIGTNNGSIVILKLKLRSY